MKLMKTFDEFINKLDESTKKSNLLTKKYRSQKLAGIEIDDLENKYCIIVSVPDSEEKILLLEHEKYQSFQRTSNRFLQHPANTNIPVQAHYHVYPNNSNMEIYAVNMDGTAHHKKNRGYEVPKKEAEELRKFGVQIPGNRIIENRQIDISNNVWYQVFLLIE